MIMLVWIILFVCVVDTFQFSISEEEIEDIFRENSNMDEKIREMELKLINGGRTIKPDAPVTDLNLIRSRRTDPLIRMLESKQLIFGEVTNILMQKYNLSIQDVHETFPQQSPSGEHFTRAQNECAKPISARQCIPNSRYRRADGTCNNLQNPEWGSSGICFKRYLPPGYTGQSGFRQSVSGGPLPAPRVLSLNVHNNLNRPTNYVTHLYTFFGQLVAHEMSQTPTSVTVDNQDIQCCPDSSNTHPQCAPIIIPRNDPFYSQFGTTCINFVRSAICPTCALGPRQLLNINTAFLDGSFVYGNSENETRSLRTLDGTGKLRSTNTKYGELLPSSPDPSNDFCSVPEKNKICFEAGDSRVNLHPPLTSLQTLFMREHNRVASGLSMMNPSWNEEKLFQETRRIIGAEIQAIVYGEYLPITLGSDRMYYFNLSLSTTGTRYDENLDPSLHAEFSTAAMRFGHTLINSIIANRPLNATNQRFLLRDSYFQPFGLRRGLMDPLMKGIASSPAQWYDGHLVPDTTNYLYRIRGDEAGLDLAAINIQRGRDHGLPTYVDMVHFCSDGKIEIEQFSDLNRSDYRLMDFGNAEALRKNYRDVKDVDLWTGILSERPLNGAVVGPTAACIIGSQFNRIKYGDRFYFEHMNQAGSFSNQQIQELRKVTLANIICLNTKVEKMTTKAMLFPSIYNPDISCSEVTGVDLSYWKES